MSVKPEGLLGDIKTIKCFSSSSESENLNFNTYIYILILSNMYQIFNYIYHRSISGYLTLKSI